MSPLIAASIFHLAAQADSGAADHFVSDTEANIVAFCEGSIPATARPDGQLNTPALRKRCGWDQEDAIIRVNKQIKTMVDWDSNPNRSTPRLYGALDEEISRCKATSSASGRVDWVMFESCLKAWKQATERGKPRFQTVE